MRAFGPEGRHDHRAPGAQSREQVGFVFSGLKPTAPPPAAFHRRQFQLEPLPSLRSEDPIMTVSLRRDPLSPRQAFRSNSAA